MSYEERVVDPKGDVYVVGSASERARLIAQGYKDYKPEQSTAKTESVDGSATPESSPARRKQ